jgi:L-aspartate oxidase
LPPLPTNIAPPQSWQGDEALLRAIQATMSEKVGVVRDGDGLRQALKRLAELGERATGLGRAWVTTAWLIAMAALTREESRGAHFRRDFPQPDDARWRVRLIWQSQGTEVWQASPLMHLAPIRPFNPPKHPVPNCAG